jgi:hypothetical protein
MYKRPLFSTLLGLAALSVMPAHAGLLLDTVDGGQNPETRGPESAILTFIQVGPSDVAISGFGTLGQMTADGNAKWVIFDNSSTPQLLFATDPVALTATTTDQWYDSPAITFTLQANQDYYMGLIADQAFTYNWEHPCCSAVATPESANGLTAPLGPNGNANTFANPVWAGSGSVQQSIRIFGPDSAADAPEPGSIALMGVGLIGLAVTMRKRFALVRTNK